jgi:hypothetical protein
VRCSRKAAIGEYKAVGACFTGFWIIYRFSREMRIVARFLRFWEVGTEGEETVPRN